MEIDSTTITFTREELENWLIEMGESNNAICVPRPNIREATVLNSEMGDDNISNYSDYFHSGSRIPPSYYMNSSGTTPWTMDKEDIDWKEELEE